MTSVSSTATGSPTNPKNDVHNGAAELLIRTHLESELPRHLGHSIQITKMGWEPLERQTSFSAQILTLELSNGNQLKLFVKDYSSSSLPKDGLIQRSLRELGLYRDLLAQAALDTPRFYGAVQQPGESGFYLLIEFVEGIWLDYRGFDDWTRAAAWLGKLHGSFMNRQENLANADYLIVHDATFFSAAANRALESVGQFSSNQAKRLGKVLSGYDEFVNIMAAQPVTLVHGSFRLRNVLVTPGDGSVRICPVDWELAARGGGMYDLAFVADGFDPQKVDILLDAYLEELNRRAAAWAPREELTHVIHCYRLHKIMKSLGDSVSLKFSANAVDEYVDMAIAVRRVLNSASK